VEASSSSSLLLGEPLGATTKLGVWLRVPAGVFDGVCVPVLLFDVVDVVDGVFDEESERDAVLDDVSDEDGVPDGDCVFDAVIDALGELVSDCEADVVIDGVANDEGDSLVVGSADGSGVTVGADVERADGLGVIDTVLVVLGDSDVDGDSEGESDSDGVIDGVTEQVLFRMHSQHPLTVLQELIPHSNPGQSLSLAHGNS
jgi:hypothetical protein